MSRISSMLCAAVAVCLAASDALAAITVTTNETTVTVTSTSSPTLTVPFLAPDVSKVIFSISAALYYHPAEDSTYTGGTDVRSGQLYIKRDGALGTGPVTIGAVNDSSILVNGSSVTLANKVIFGPKTCYVVGFSGRECITLKSVGVVESGSSHAIRIGRANAGVESAAVLSLTDPDSEPVDRVWLSGQLALTLDGGTIKARQDAYSPFFRTVYSSDRPDVSVSTNGVAFDVPSRADVFLGVPLAFQTGVVCTAALETYSPVNNSFESGLSPWSIVATPPNTQTGEVRSNGSPFDTEGSVKWYTPDGSNYAVLRHDAVLSTIVNVPSDGHWRVRFKLGCRPKGSYSIGIRTDVKIDGATICSVPALTATDQLHPFIEIVTDPFVMTGGEDHTLAFANVGGVTDTVMTFDMITLERVNVTSYDVGTFAKTGEGRLSLVDQPFHGADTSVARGTLALYGCDMDDMTLSVGACATGALYCAEIGTNAVVDVASGGTLFLGCTHTNLLTNGGFEAQQYAFSPDVAPTGWEKVSDPETEKNMGNGSCSSGVQKNGSQVSANGPYTPYGNETAFLREYTHLSQRINVAEPGTYRVSFVQACRNYETGYKMPLSVSINGTTILEVPAHSASYDYERHSVDIQLPAGSHLVKFSTSRSPSGYNGEMVFLDDVSVTKVETYPEVAGTIRMSRGSTLEVDDALELRILNFEVDGVPVHGRRGAAMAAGVTVTGGGNIRFGEKQGMVIYFK